MAKAVADKIGACNYCENVWTAEDLHNPDGELYEGSGVGWACNERLCPNCQVTRSCRARKNAREAIARPTPLKGERYWFLTLTAPTLSADQVSLSQTIEVIARAWRLFRQRSWWRQSIRAGVKGTEFTLGEKYKSEGREWNPTIDGFHVHLHLLLLSRWLDRQTLREEWTTALLTAWSEAGIQQGVNTKDGLAVCHLQPVTQANSESAIKEVAKYITKGNSWLSIPDRQLVEVASVERWPRMFELLGECRGKGGKRSKQRSEASTNSVSTVTIEERLQCLENDGSTSDVELARRARAEIYVCLALEPETKTEIESRTRYLDTNDVSVGGSRDGPIAPTRHRPQSLRTIGAEMIKRGERARFREMMAQKIFQVQEFRRSQQVRRYPFAKFTSLNGHTWFGLRANPASLGRLLK
jgi:hypothetical protein